LLVFSPLAVPFPAKCANYECLNGRVQSISEGAAFRGDPIMPCKPPRAQAAAGKSWPRAIDVIKNARGG